MVGEPSGLLLGFAGSRLHLPSVILREGKALPYTNIFSRLLLSFRNPFGRRAPVYFHTREGKALPYHLRDGIQNGCQLALDSYTFTP
jgi:hypothetical protein